MKKVLLIALSACFSKLAAAQDIPLRRLPGEVFRSVKKEEDTAAWKWKRGGLFSASLAQGSLSNWAAGGDNFSMSINSYVNYYVLYRKDKHTWDNSVDFNLGFVKTTSLGSRKNDDRIDILSKYGYKVDSTSKWYFSTLVNFRSQFFDGYNYSGSSKSLSSTLFSPAYALISIGMDYKPTPKFSLFLSPLTSRWVIIASSFLSDQGLYGVPAGNHSVNELGAFGSLNYANAIAKNVTYKGKMDLFSNYKNNPKNVDIFLTNILSFKINKFLSATYNLDLIYDDDVKLFGPGKDAPRLQLKSLIGIGFLMPFEPKRIRQ